MPVLESMSGEVEIEGVMTSADSAVMPNLQDHQP